jgi:hypothetical protein
MGHATPMNDDWSQLGLGCTDASYHVFSGIPDILVLSLLHSDSSIIKIERKEEGVIECKESASATEGDSQLFGTLLLLGACSASRQLVLRKTPAATMKLKAS